MDEFSDFSLDDLKKLRTDAVKARHQLATMPSSAASHNRSISYQRQISELDAYIARLNKAIQVRQNPDLRRSPIYIVGPR